MTVFSADKFSSGDIAARAEYFEKGEGILLEDGQEPERSTGGEDYYHRPGADTLLTEYLGQGAQLMELGINPQDGDYAALMSGTNPRTGKSYVTERRQGELQRGTGLAGYSTSFNIDKTLSLVYAALPREQQVLFEKAVMEASRRTMEYAEGKVSFSGDNCTNQRSLMPAVHPAPDSPISGLPRTKLVYVHYSCASK